MNEVVMSPVDLRCRLCSEPVGERDGQKRPWVNEAQGPAHAECNAALGQAERERLMRPARHRDGGR